ncbi:MAG: trehalose-6-phosphate synthase [Microthrixaceae bacterium]
MDDTSNTPSSGKAIVIVSNRGPVSYEISNGQPVAKRGGGGLISGLAPLLDSGQATWIAAAMTDGDRLVAISGRDSNASVDRSSDSSVDRSSDSSVDSQVDDSVELIALDPEDQRLHYDVISNGTLWFLHHGLYDLVRSPSYRDDWQVAWDAYRRVNRAFAERVVQVAPVGATVLVQDYHLTLLPQTLVKERPDLTLIHFLHTPFAGPENLRVMPDAARSEMLTSLMAHHACGFHTSDWAANFRESVARFADETIVDGPESTNVFTSTLSSDISDIRQVAQSAECRVELEQIDALVGDRDLIVRVDRMELSKNIVRGFEAFDLLLEQKPHMRGRVVFFACCYPSREGVAEYAQYRDEVIESARWVNERWGTDDWQPVTLNTDDNFPRSVAALSRYDVLLVNPIRDGLNLVAKEGPTVNGHSGQLVLSTQAGAWSELKDCAFGVNPFDVAATADALAAALALSGPDRERRAKRLGELAGERTPADWLADQLAV